MSDDDLDWIGGKDQDGDDQMSNRQVAWEVEQEEEEEKYRYETPLTTAKPTAKTAMFLFRDVCTWPELSYKTVVFSTDEAWQIARSKPRLKFWHLYDPHTQMVYNPAGLEWIEPEYSYIDRVKQAIWKQAPSVWDKYAEGEKAPEPKKAQPARGKPTATNAFAALRL
jgi:hypothetical protein